MSGNNKTVYLQKGLASYYDKDFDQAIVFFRMAISSDPKCDDAYYLRGLCFERKGDIDLALSDYTKALWKGINSRPSIFDTYLLAFNRDPRYFSINHSNSNARPWWEQAISDYTKPIEIAVREALYWCKQGRIYKNDGAFSQSMIQFNKALEIDHLNVLALYQRGHVWKSLDNYKEAISDFSKVLELNPMLSQVYYIRGQMYFKIDEYEKARDDLNRAKSMGYNHPQYLKELEYLGG